jgi:hypothetical protein
MFTLEFTEQQARKHLKSLEADGGSIVDGIQIFTSDQISADYIIGNMSGLEPGTVAVIDYLQLLDQQRTKPLLSEQLQTLSDFAHTTGVIFGFISQIDRSFEGKANGFLTLTFAYQISSISAFSERHAFFTTERYSSKTSLNRQPRPHQGRGTPPAKYPEWRNVAVGALRFVPIFANHTTIRYAGDDQYVHSYLFRATIE